MALQDPSEKGTTVKESIFFPFRIFRVFSCCYLFCILGFAVIAGCAYYAIKSETKYLGYSYSLCICGGSGAVVVGFLLCLDVRREQEPEVQVVTSPQVCNFALNPYSETHGCSRRHSFFFFFSINKT